MRGYGGRAPRLRVVSLVPSLTETLVEWDVDVVGRTRFCLHGSCPPLGGTKDPDVPAVIALRPDLVVANHEENRKEDVEALRAAGLTVLLTDIRSLDQAASEFRRLGEAVGRPAQAAALAAAMEAIDRRPAVTAAVCFIWRRPWMAVGRGTYSDDVLCAAGIRNMVTVPRYPEIGLEAARAMGAEVALLPSEPYPFTERQVPEVEHVFGAGRAVLFDGRWLTWYGPGAPAAVASLAELVHSAT